MAQHRPNLAIKVLQSIAGYGCSCAGDFVTPSPICRRQCDQPQSCEPMFEGLAHLDYIILYYIVLYCTMTSAGRVRQLFGGKAFATRRKNSRAPPDISSSATGALP